MKRWTTALCLGLLLAPAACGLTEGEEAGLLDPTSVNCPSPDSFGFEQAASRAELVVHARPSESFFVDNCHRAFLLDVESVWKGFLPDPVLAIVQVDPREHVERWTDLDMGDSAVFLLERDPEVPEAFRPVGAGGVIPVVDDIARICHDGRASACETEMIPVSALQDLIEVPSFFDHGHGQSPDENRANEVDELDLEEEEMGSSPPYAPTDELLDEPLEEEALDDLDYEESEIIDPSFADLQG